MRRLSLLVLATWLLLQPAAHAFEFRTGDVTIPAGTVINDDLYVAGGDVRIDGTVTGDLVVAAGDVTVTGDVRQDLIVVGGDLNLRGRVGQSVRAAGGTLHLSGSVGKDVLLAGGTVTQEDDTRVRGEGAYAGGNVTIGGRVGEVVVGGGDVTLRGRLGATNVEAGDLTVNAATRIDGPLTYRSDATADIATGATITGGVTHQVRPARTRNFPGKGWGWGFWVGLLLASFVSGAVLALLLPRAAERVADEIEVQPLLALLIGFALVVGLPVALVFMLVTVVGIPLSLALFGLYLVTWHVGWLLAALALGDAVLRRRATFKSLLARLMAGLAFGLPVLMVVQLIPVFGWLVGFLAVCVGFGGIALAVAKSRTPATPPAEPPVVGPATAVTP